MPKTKRGGKREGAGRPATINATIRTTVTLDETTLAKLQTISPNISEAIRILAARSE